jgi:hypothetical protein
VERLRTTPLMRHGIDERAGLRIASGVAVGVWVLAALIVLGRAGIGVVPLPYGVLRWGTWVFVGLLFVGALMNIASSSGWERFGWGPVALILGVLCLLVAEVNPLPEENRPSVGVTNS